MWRILQFLLPKLSLFFFVCLFLTIYEFNWLQFLNDDNELLQADETVRFQSGCNKMAIELRVVQFSFEIILVISNRAHDFRPNYFPLSSITIINLYSNQP